MNYTEKDLDKALDELLIQRGEHATRVRNPLYAEERELAKSLVKLFAIQNVIKSVCHEPTEPCQSFLNHGFAVCQKCDNFY